MSIKYKRILLFFLCTSVFTCAALVIYILKSSPDTYYTENFTTITLFDLVESIPCDSENEICDQSEFSPFVEVGQASGLAFKTIGDKTYILTADHFCSHNDYEYSFYYDVAALFPEQMMAITDVKGNVTYGVPIYTDRDLDLCLIETDAMNVPDIDVSLTMPTHGEKVYTISAPQGTSGLGYVIHLEGRFSGCDEETVFCFFSIPATFGSSGSLILDQDGDIVGMIQMTQPGLQFISIGVGSDQIFIFLYEASSHLGISLL